MAGELLAAALQEREQTTPAPDTRVVVLAGGGLPESPQVDVSLAVFLCHSRDDKPATRDLYSRLFGDGYQPWLDEEDLLPGQDWDAEIRKAIRSCHVMIVCLSQASIGKAGYLQKEIKLGLDVADEQPEGSIYLIPLRLEPCEVPERLRHLQWVDLFDERGYDRLTRTLRHVRAKQSLTLVARPPVR